MKYFFIPFLFVISSANAFSQVSDSVSVGKKIITLSEVVVDNKLNVPSFISRIKNDRCGLPRLCNIAHMSCISITKVRSCAKSDLWHAG